MSDTAHPVSDVMHRIWISAILFGALAVILGVVILVWPGPSIVVAAVLFGVYLVMSGAAMVILALALAISYPRFPGRGWSIFFGIISTLAGVVVLVYPFDSIVTLALVVGIWLIILGVMEVISAFGMRSDVKKVKNITGTADQPAVA
jgi:uncharacterized membrane protein HdeD (DUF308 family)